jgi:hypothetical protein
VIREVWPAMQDFECEAAQKSTSRCNPLVAQLLAQLDSAVVYSRSDNAQCNKKLWDNYSNEWAANAPW